MDANYFGIDVGRDGFSIARAMPGAPREVWPVDDLRYRDPNWVRLLRNALTPPAVVAVEPTGWTYLAPILNAYRASETKPIFYLVSHNTSAQFRKALAGDVKNDRSDARVLAQVGFLAHRGNLAGVHKLDFFRDYSIQPLRYLVNEFARQRKGIRRVKQQQTLLLYEAYPMLAARPEFMRRLFSLGLFNLKDMAGLQSRSAPSVADSPRDRTFARPTARRHLN